MSIATIGGTSVHNLKTNNTTLGAEFDNSSDTIESARAELYTVLNCLQSLIKLLDVDQGLVQLGDDGKVQTRSLLDTIDTNHIQDNSIDGTKIAEGQITKQHIGYPNTVDGIEYDAINSRVLDPALYGSATDITNSVTTKFPTIKAVRDYLATKTLDADIRGTVYITSWQVGSTAVSSISSGGNAFTYNIFGIKNVGDNAGVGDPCAVVGIEFENYTYHWQKVGNLPVSSIQSYGVGNYISTTQSNNRKTDNTMSFKFRLHYVKVTMN